MARVLLESIVKKYGDLTVIHDLNIDIRDKEFLVLVGPSGCGKSTVLRMIAGLEDITGGSLFIGENLVNDVHPKDRDIAMVFQSYALYPHMTVFDNMAFGLRMRKVPIGGSPPLTDGHANGGAANASSTTDDSTSKSANGGGTSATATLQARETREAAIRRRVEEVADGLGLRPYLNRKPAQLSGGQRQRVALGRAIVREPEVFLMDEPLSNLDAKMRVATRAELQKLHRRLGVTIIYVTHDQVEAMTMGDRIAVMKDGVLQQLDTPQRLYDRPANVFVAGFIGSPAMNMFMAEVQGDSQGLSLVSPGFKVRVPEQHAQKISGYTGKQVMLGMRPENIHDLRFNRNADPATVVTATTDVVEPMGHDVYIYLMAGDLPFIARLDDRTDTGPGQPIKVVFDMEKMHAFDPESQISLL